MAKRRLKLVLPEMECVPGCTDCCGVVPVTAGEAATIVAYISANGVKPVDNGATCPFARAGGCGIYPVRPRVCQAFGHSTELTCPHGRSRNVDPVALRAWVLAPGLPSTTLHRLCGFM
jgi:Fe-S-cluster containining protein